MIQYKLAIGQPNDKYEQEADRVADQVMRMPEPGSVAWRITHPGQAPAVQRVCAECEDELQIQTKAIASAITPLVQKQAEVEEEQIIQAKENSGQSPSVTPTLEAQLNASRSSGQPLPKQTRSFMESRFGHDFRQIRIHTNLSSDQMNRSLNAQAFTHQHNIYFKSGKYRPESNVGKHLLAHELTHVVQQSALNPPVQQLQRDPESAAPPSPTTSPTSPTNPASAGLSVSMGGLSFLPAAQSVFRSGAKVRQAFEIVLARLVGSQYTVELVDELYPQLVAAGWSGLGTLAGDATEGEEITLFTIPLQESLQIIVWLENVKNLQVRLTSSQRDLLSYGIAASSAWQDMNLPDIAREIDTPFPQWYNETLFQQQIAGNIRLLRQYIDAVMAYRTERSAGNRQLVINALTEIAIEFEYASAILEAIRADSTLIDHEVYQLLWPSPQPEGSTPPLPPVMASPNSPPNPAIASSFLSFVHSQSSLATQSFTQTSARQELMDRFARFLGRSLTSTPGGDQQVTETPATANTPPLESRLHVSPPLSGAPGGAQFEASAVADYRFMMQILFPDVFTAFTSYYFEWNYVRVPDEQIGTSVNIDDLESQQPSFGSVATRRFGRAGQYAVEDVQTLFSELGPAGIGAVSLVAANAILRFIGTGIRLGFELITMPNSEKSIAFPEPGVYLVRSKAIPYQTDEAELVRPPSVAFQPVIVRNPTEIVEDRVQQDAAAAMRDFERMQELRGLLAEPVSYTNEAELRQELDRLERALSSVGGSLDVQREQLVEYLRSLPEGTDAQRQAQRQLEQLDALIALRRTRAEDRDITGAEPLIASFISDDGRSIRLTMEAVFQSATDDGVTYWVSDLTTANSSQETSIGSDRAAAIMNAIENILRGYAGYGRGQVSVRIDGQTHTRRITASLGSLFNEALENVTLALSLAVVAAAPFTGGASLALLLPIGAVGAIPSAYRLINRSIDDTLRFDMATVMDVVNLLGGFVGLAHAATPMRMVNVGRAFMIMGLGADGLGMLLIPVGIVSQIAELEGLPPGERAARIMEILGQAMLNVGIIVGGALAQRARQRQMESSRHSSTPDTESSTSLETPQGGNIREQSGALDSRGSSGVSTSDGRGRLRVNSEGQLVRCSSPCTELRVLYAQEIADNPILQERLDRVENHLQNADPSDYRVISRLYSELSSLESALQGLQHIRLRTLTPAKAEFPGHVSTLDQIEFALSYTHPTEPALSRPRSDMAEVINEVAQLQTQENLVTSFEVWLDRASGSANRVVTDSTNPSASAAVREAALDIHRLIGEVHEARRLAYEYANSPDTTIRFLEESVDPATGEKIPGFDLAVQIRHLDGTTTTERQTDVFRESRDIAGASVLDRGILHGADKRQRIIDKTGSAPSGNVESTVQINWPPSGQVGNRIYQPDGEYEFVGSGGQTHTPGSGGQTHKLVDDILRRLNGSGWSEAPRAAQIDAVSIIDQNGNLIWRFRNNTPGTLGGWK